MGQHKQHYNQRKAGRAADTLALAIVHCVACGLCPHEHSHGKQDHKPTWHKSQGTYVPRQAASDATWQCTPWPDNRYGTECHKLPQRTFRLTAPLLPESAMTFRLTADWWAGGGGQRDTYTLAAMRDELAAVSRVLDAMAPNDAFTIRRIN